MEHLTLAQVAELVLGAHIEQTIELQQVIVQHGTTAAGRRFTLMNDMHGQSVVSYER